MCFLPKLNQLRRNVQTITGFGGLNERAAIADNEFSDCFNISPEEYPALGVRGGWKQFELLPSGSHNYFSRVLEARSKKDIMLIQRDQKYEKPSEWGYPETIVESDAFLYADDKNINLYSYSHPSKDGKSYYLNGCDRYNGEIALLSTRYQKADGYYTKIEIYNNHLNKTTEIQLPITLLDKDTYKKNLGFMAFGSRLIIVNGCQLHISFDNDISAEKWTTYTIKGEDGSTKETTECAQEITLLDDGDFTGCINYRDYPVFFKENSMYILYNEYTPFTLSRIDTIGCPYPDTIAICGGALYFLSKQGVMEYTGSTPRLISQNLNLCSNNSTVPHSACADNRYYYIDDYIFDTYTRTWSKQKIDCTGEGLANGYHHLLPQCYFGGKIYAAGLIWAETDPVPNGTTQLYCTDTTDLSDWSFTTKQFHEYEAGKKLVSRLAIGFENSSATKMKIEVSIDKGGFQTVYTWGGNTDFAKEVPLVLPYCDYFQIKVSGTGKMLVHYIKRFYRVVK